MLSQINAATVSFRTTYLNLLFFRNLEIPCILSSYGYRMPCLSQSRASIYLYCTLYSMSSMVLLITRSVLLNLNFLCVFHFQIFCKQDSLKIYFAFFKLVSVKHFSWSLNFLVYSFLYTITKVIPKNHIFNTFLQMHKDPVQTRFPVLRSLFHVLV